MKKDLAAIIAAVDVQTGPGVPVVTPSKGKGKYCIRELKKFIVELCRSYGICILNLHCKLWLLNY